jgi:CheY-like chemotaxis protein
MEIICDSCQTKLKIPDEKIPEGKKASFSCPKCKGKITIPPDDNSEPAAVDDASGDLGDLGFEEESFGEADDSAADKPFQFIEEEGEIALVCESDPVIRKRVNDILTLMEYHVTTATDAREALKKIRYQNYDVVVVNELFGTENPDENGILIYLERLSMDTRRNMFVAMITDRYRTMDYMMAFNKSVNLIINKENAAEMDKILSKGLTDYDMFYRIYKETLQ